MSQSVSTCLLWVRRLYAFSYPDVSSRVHEGSRIEHSLHKEDMLLVTNSNPRDWWRKCTMKGEWKHHTLQKGISSRLYCVWHCHRRRARVHLLCWIQECGKACKLYQFFPGICSFSIPIQLRQCRRFHASFCFIWILWLEFAWTKTSEKY